MTREIVGYLARDDYPPDKRDYLDEYLYVTLYLHEPKFDRYQGTWRGPLSSSVLMDGMCADGWEDYAGVIVDPGCCKKVRITVEEVNDGSS